MAGNAQATITWNAVYGATSYNVYYSSTNSNNPAIAGVKITGAISGIPVTGLSNGKTYYFVVTALNSAGESSQSSVSSATPFLPVVGHTIVYSITGNDTGNLIPTYNNATGGIDQPTVSTLPWSITISGLTSFYSISLSAFTSYASTGGCSITGTITVDGVLYKTASSTSGVSCSINIFGGYIGNDGSFNP